MATIPWAEIEGRNAAIRLGEGDPSAAAEILKGDMEISRELRDTIALMLEGGGPNNTRLIVKPMNGPIKKSSFTRDFDIHDTVKTEITNTGDTLEVVCERLSGLSGLGEESIRKAYQRAKRAIDDYEQASNEARSNDG